MIILLVRWNRFLKEFCADEYRNNYSNKLKVAAILWKKLETQKMKKYIQNNFWMNIDKKSGCIVNKYLSDTF